MSKRKTIAILFHETTSPTRIRSFRIWHCAQVWEQMGIEVRYILGADAAIDTDLLIPQVDLSVLPETYRALVNSAELAVNRGVVDIRKSSFSQNLVSLDDDYDGPVIIKTDRNCGGLPKRAVSRKPSPCGRALSRLQRGMHAIQRIASTASLSRLAYAGTIKPQDYPVYPSKRQTPRAAFRNPDLVVEKFLPETDGRYYYLRSYAFFGSEGLAVRMRSEYPVVKGSFATGREFVPVDESIVAARHALGFDYGKFDYVIHDGEAVLLDTNTTPTFGPVYPPEMRSLIAAQLANGISNWFPEEAH